jgi:hypothetical protein
MLLFSPAEPFVKTQLCHSGRPVCFGGESNIMNFETGKSFYTLLSFYAFNTELLHSVAQLACISHIHVFVLCKII